MLEDAALWVYDQVEETRFEDRRTIVVARKASVRLDTIS
jgi:hypothetical protein